jgi:D-aminopeptidase
MIAWERHIDGTRDDGEALYSRLAAPVAFADGTSALYGFGLARQTELGRAATGHGGALRGWRSHRMYLPSERVSVVVLFNHLSDAHEAALDVLAAVLGEDRPQAPDLPAPDWLGTYVEPENRLVVRIDSAETGRVRLRYGPAAEKLDLCADGSAGRSATRLRRGQGGLWMDRPQENRSSLLRPCEGTPSTDIAGRYRCEELNAELDVIDAGGVLAGGFSGFLGQGRMEPLEPIGSDTWMLPCPRALDHSPPGNWTLIFRRNDNGRPAGVDLGCWLAPRLDYIRIE